MSQYSLLERAELAYYRLIPTPSAEAPPGSETFLKVLNWIFWGGLIVSVIGFIYAGVSMIFAHSRGDGGEHTKKLGLVAIGSVIIGSASAFAAAATGQ